MPPMPEGQPGSDGAAPNGHPPPMPFFIGGYPPYYPHPYGIIPPPPPGAQPDASGSKKPDEPVDGGTNGVVSDTPSAEDGGAKEKARAGTSNKAKTPSGTPQVRRDGEEDGGEDSDSAGT